MVGMTVRRVLAALVTALLLATPVLAAPAPTGLVQLWDWWTKGYESSLVISRTPPHCFVTDDWSLQLWSGTLGPGQTFEARVDFCYRADVVLLREISDNHESMIVNADGRGNLRLEVVSALFTSGYETAETTNSRDYWQGCGLFEYRQQDAAGWYAGPVFVRLTNVGSRTARDVSLLAEVSLDASGFRARCAGS